MGRVKRAAHAGGTRHAHAAAAPRAIGCAILTVSDTRDASSDASGDAIERLLSSARHAIVSRAWVRDEVAAVRRAAQAVLRRRDVDVVVVTGGTGIAKRDRTPEALEPLFEKTLPGFGELFRSLSTKQVGSAAWLSRASAGVAKGRLLVLLPGSTRAVELAMRKLLLPELGHAVRLLGRFEGGR
jgi:molybdenum cofactor biosynthesis protein B